jgi:lysophospholipase L1-like esterase
MREAGAAPADEGEFQLRWYADEPRIGRLRHELRRLRRLGDENGFAVVVLIIPFLERDFDGSYEYSAAHRIVASEARRAGLRVIDAKDAFMRVSAESLRVDPRDWVHPNEDGSDILAGLVAPEVIKLGRSARAKPAPRS